MPQKVKGHRSGLTLKKTTQKSDNMHDLEMELTKKMDTSRSSQASTKIFSHISSTIKSISCPEEILCRY